MKFFYFRIFPKQTTCKYIQSKRLTFIFEKDTVSRVLGKNLRFNMSFLRMQKKSKGQNSEKIEGNSVDKKMDSEQIGKFVYPTSEMFVIFLFVCISFYWSVMSLR